MAEQTTLKLCVDNVVEASLKIEPEIVSRLLPQITTRMSNLFDGVNQICSNK